MDADAIIGAQLEYLRSHGPPRSKRAAKLEAKLVRDIDKLEKVETDLTRTFRKWSKLREAIKRTTATLDKIAKETEPS